MSQSSAPLKRQSLATPAISWTFFRSAISWSKKNASHYAAALFATALLARHLHLRLPGLLKPFWTDDILHNRSTLYPITFFKFRAAMDAELQPMLEYVLRRYFWFPLFGHQELWLRLPSLIYSTLSLGLLYWISRRTLAGFAALLVGFWFCQNGSEMFFATEARHYSFVILLGTAWTLSFTLRPARLTAFLVLSVLLLNTHFFCYPLIGLAFAYEIAVAFYQGRFVQARNLFLFFLVAVGLSLCLNFPAVRHLLLAPPGDSPPFDGARFSATAVTFLNCITFFALPFFPGWLWCLFPLFALDIKPLREKAGVVSLLLFIGLPLTLFLISASSTYFISDRYFTPFFGVGVAILFLGMESLQVIFLKAPKAPKFVWSALAAGVCFLLLWPLCQSKVWSYPYRENVSREAALFVYLKTNPRPVLVFASPCWGLLIPEFYWDEIGPVRARRAVNNALVGDSNECVADNLHEGKPGAKRLQRFLDRGGSTLIFYELNNECRVKGPTTFGPSIRVRQIVNRRAVASERSCYLAVEGVQHVSQVRQVLAAYQLHITDPNSPSQAQGY